MAAVELVAVGLADAVDQLHLQRNDGQRGQVLRQQLQCAVQDGRVQDRGIQASVVHPGCARRHRRRRCQRRAAGGCGCGCRAGQRLGLLVKVAGHRPVQPQQAVELREKVAFGGRLRAIGIAHAHRHLVGQQPSVGARQPRHRGDQ